MNANKLWGTAGASLHALFLAFALSGCAPSFYQTRLTAEDRAIVCNYSEPSERDNCLVEADSQIEWCKEALGQERDCWNTLLGDAAHLHAQYPVKDAEYFSYLHDPQKLKPLIARIRHDHPELHLLAPAS